MTPKECASLLSHNTPSSHGIKASTFVTSYIKLVDFQNCRLTRELLSSAHSLFPFTLCSQCLEQRRVAFSPVLNDSRINQRITLRPRHVASILPFVLAKKLHWSTLAPLKVQPSQMRNLILICTNTFKSNFLMGLQRAQLPSNFGEPRNLTSVLFREQQTNLLLMQIECQRTLWKMSCALRFI